MPGHVAASAPTSTNIPATSAWHAPLAFAHVMKQVPVRSHLVRITSLFSVRQIATAVAVVGLVWVVATNITYTQSPLKSIPTQAAAPPPRSPVVARPPSPVAARPPETGPSSPWTVTVAPPAAPEQPTPTAPTLPSAVTELPSPAPVMANPFTTYAERYTCHAKGHALCLRIDRSTPTACLSVRMMEQHPWIDHSQLIQQTCVSSVIVPASIIIAAQLTRYSLVRDDTIVFLSPDECSGLATRARQVTPCTEYVTSVSVNGIPTTMRVFASDTITFKQPIGR